MRITVLTDNLAPADLFRSSFVDPSGNRLPAENLLSEWGLSFHIEYQGARFLLDMGSTDVFARNAKALGIDLAKVDYSMLSHAHYDHSDGMEAFFDRNAKARLLIRKGTGENCYGLNSEGQLHYIGIKEGSLKRFSDRIEYVDGDYSVCEGVYLIPHKTPGLESIGRKVGMRIRVKDTWKTDDFSHEQSLVFREKDGLVVLNSCSHAGPKVIIHEIMKTFPGEKVKMYLGGLHLYRSSEDEVRELGRVLRELEVGRIYTGHCTGEEAFRILKEELGERICQFCSGYSIGEFSGKASV